MSDKPLVVFENRAWSEAEYPRLVSNRVPVVYNNPNTKSVVFEVGRHYPKEKFVLQTYNYALLEKIPGKLDPCGGGWDGFFNTVHEAIEYVKNLGYVVRVKGACPQCGCGKLNIITKDVQGEYTTWDCPRCKAQGLVKHDCFFPN